MKSYKTITELELNSIESIEHIPAFSSVILASLSCEITLGCPEPVWYLPVQKNWVQSGLIDVLHRSA